MYANTHTEASATGRVHHGDARGGPRHHPPGRQRRRRRRRDLLRLRSDRRDRQAHPAAGARAAQSARWSSSGPTSTIPTSFRGASRSPTSSPSARTTHGRVDLEHLEHELRRHADRRVKLGSFSAASNVTGIVTDVDQVAITLHRYGAKSCWDYAAAGPYLPIDMNAAPDIPNGPLAYKDAVFVSPHKFIGGPGNARRPGGQALAGAQPRPLGPGRRDHPVRHPNRAPLPPRAGDPRGGRDPRHRRVDPRRPRVRAEGGRRQRRDPPPRARLRAPRAALVGHEPADRDPGQPRARAPRDRLARPAPPGGPAARELRRRRPQRPVRHPGAQRMLLRGPLHPPHVSRRRRVVAAHGRRGRARATWAPSSRSRGSASTTSSARRSSPTSSTPSTWSPSEG